MWGVGRRVGVELKLVFLGAFQLSSSAAGIVFTLKVKGKIDGQGDEE